MTRSWFGVYVAVALFCGCAGGFNRVESPRYTVDFPSHWKLKHVTTGDGDPTTLLVRPDPEVDYAQLLYGPLSGKPVDEETNVEDNQGFGDSIVSVLSGGDYAVLEQDEAAERDSAIRYALKQVEDLSEVEIGIFTWPLPPNVVEQDPSQLVFERLSTQSDAGFKSQRQLGAGEHGCGMSVPLFSVFGKAVSPVEGEKVPSWRSSVLGVIHGTRLVGIVGRVPYASDEGLYCINLAHMRIALQDVADWIEMRPEQSAAGGAGRLGLRSGRL